MWMPGHFMQQAVMVLIQMDLKPQLRGSMELLFDSRKRPTPGLNNVRWQEGSWNAQ